MTRVNGILAAKINQITEQHTKPAQHIDDHQRAELVHSGKVKLRSDISSISTYDDVSKVFDFSKFSWASGMTTREWRRCQAVTREGSVDAEDILRSCVRA